MASSAGSGTSVVGSGSPWWRSATTAGTPWYAGRPGQPPYRRRYGRRTSLSSGSPGAPAAQLRGHQPLGSQLERGREAAGVRADEDARQRPERVVGRQRLGVGHVEAASIRPARASAVRASVSTTAPRDVDEQRAVLHPREERGVDETARLVGERGDEHDDVDVGQQLRQASWPWTCTAPPARRTGSRRRGAVRGDADDVDLEAGELPLDGLPMPP